MMRAKLSLSRPSFLIRIGRSLALSIRRCSPRFPACEFPDILKGNPTGLPPSAG